MTESGGELQGGRAGIRGAFRELKRRGPQILVTGDVPESVSRRASHRLLGHPAEQRYRLLALTDSDAGGDAWLPGEVTDADENVVVLRNGELRSAAAYRAGGLAPSRGTDDDVVNQIERAVDEWLSSVSAPAPSVLRVGIYSLETLLEEHGVDAVRSFSYQLTGTVREARGMGHYHLPRATESDAVEELRYVFDARLELRTTGDGAGAEQRWHIPGTGTTGWVELDAQP